MGWWSARALATASSSDGVRLSGTRESLQATSTTGTSVYAWHEIHDAAWDAETAVLRVTTLEGSVHSWQLVEPARLLQLVRERITHSVVLRREIDQVTFVVRRDPTGRLRVTHDGDRDDPALAARGAGLLAELGA